MLIVLFLYVGTDCINSRLKIKKKKKITQEVAVVIMIYSVVPSYTHTYTFLKNDQHMRTKKN